MLTDTRCDIILSTVSTLRFNMTTTQDSKIVGSDSAPIAVPVSALTASYAYYLLTQHISNAKAPLMVVPEIYLSVDAVKPPNMDRMEPNAIYITIASDGAFINRSTRRLQRYVVTAWAKSNNYAELGGRIVTKGLSRKSKVDTESAPVYDDERGLYSVQVRGYFNTLLTGREMLY